MLRANVLSATLDWELEYLSDVGYEKDLLLGAMGLAPDIYTPVGTTDPNRHPVVLWAGPINDDSIELIEKSAIDTQRMIENVQFIVIALGDEGDQLKLNVEERDLPITVVSLSDVEPIVDLIERTWACVTVPDRDFPHGLAMLALSAGIPLISVGELAEKHGFTNQLTHVGVDPEDHEGVAFGLQLLRRWSTWALRIGSAGQKLVEERYSTRTVAIKEGEQLSRLARCEDLESTTPTEAKVLRTYLSPVTGEVPAFLTGGSPAGSEAEDAADTDEDMYSDPGFDLLAAALADMPGSVPTAPSESKSDSDDMSPDAIAALFASNDADLETLAAEPVDLNGDMSEDAIAALFAANDPEPEAVAEPEAPVSGDICQDAISTLFESDEPAEDPAASSDAIETNSCDSIEDDLADDDLPEITMVQHSSDETDPELSNFDDFEAEDDIDPDLIDSILEGKGEDPAA